MKLVKISFVFLFLLVLGCGLWWYISLDKTDQIGNKGNKNSLSTDCLVGVGTDGNICSFLKMKFPYSNDEISKKILLKSSMSINKLGLEGLSRVEGLIIDYIEKDGDILLVTGFDGINGDRLVVPIRIPMSVITNKDTYISLYFYTFDGEFLDGERKEIKLKDKNEIMELLAKLKNKVVVFMLLDDPVDTESLSKIKDKEIETVFAGQIDKQTNATRALLGSVSGNSLVSEYVGLDYSMNVIKKMSDLNSINISEIPMVLNMVINLNKN